MKNWIAIIEASPHALVDLETEVFNSADCGKKGRKLFYIELLKSFYRQDSAGICKLIETHQSFLCENPDLSLLAYLRYLIRKVDFQTEEIRELLQKRQSFSILMNAEICFVAAAAFQLKGEYFESEKLYREASFYYKQVGAEKKCLRALLSSVAAYSCAHPESRLFAEYMDLYRRALNLGESLAAATALLNVSREFQRLEALSIAVEYVSEGIDLLKEFHLGSREFGLSLVHRAQLFYEMKVFPSAHEDLSHALLIPHAEVQSACQAMAKKYNLNLKSLASQAVLPTWQERMKESPAEKPLTKLESRLLELISEAPRTKFEIMDSLYGDLLDFEVKENRFKNLLSRLRSRFPDLIFLDDQKYHLNDPLSRSFLKRTGNES